MAKCQSSMSIQGVYSLVNHIYYIYINLHQRRHHAIPPSSRLTDLSMNFIALTLSSSKVPHLFSPWSKSTEWTESSKFSRNSRLLDISGSLDVLAIKI